MSITLATFIWTIIAVIAIVLIRKYSQKALVDTYKSLWIDEGNARARLMLAHVKQAQELNKLRAFHRRFTALIESAKRKKQKDDKQT
jgi:hypothetical protein